MDEQLLEIINSSSESDRIKNFRRMLLQAFGSDVYRDQFQDAKMVEEAGQVLIQAKSDSPNDNFLRKNSLFSKANRKRSI
jgi:hypothetical protein